MNDVSYTKEVKISVQVDELTFENITALKSVQLSFYQKYILLLLKNGIYAESVDALCDKLSNLTNVSVLCVKEFVTILEKNNSIGFDEKQKKYCMDESVHFTIDPALGNVMFAELDEKMADCDKIVYVKNSNLLCLESNFNDAVFKRKGVSNSAEEACVPQDIQIVVRNNQEKIRELIKNFFSNSNIHLKPNFSFSLNTTRCLSFAFEFSALITYKFLSEENIAKRVNTIVVNNNFLPKDFINQISQKYDIDDKLPRFITLENDLYQKIKPNYDSLLSCEQNIIQEKSNIFSINTDINNNKKMQENVNKEHKKEKQTIIDKITQLQTDIAENSKNISIDKDLIGGTSENESKELKAQLTKEIDILKEKEKALNETIVTYNSQIITMDEQYKKQENDYTVNILNKGKELANVKDSIKQYQLQEKMLKEEHNKLICDSMPKLNPTISETLKKHPSTVNLLYRYITDICVSLDKAVAYSECQVFNDVWYCIDTIRELYRKALQAVFEVISSKKLQNLSSYLFDSFNIIEFQADFKNRKLEIGLLNKIASFHDVANAIGHSIENGPQKKYNDNRLEEFKKLPTSDRNDILLAIPMFFKNIKFSKNEITLINNRLEM